MVLFDILIKTTDSGKMVKVFCILYSINLKLQNTEKRLRNYYCKFVSNINCNSNSLTFFEKFL